MLCFHFLVGIFYLICLVSFMHISHSTEVLHDPRGLSAACAPQVEGAGQLCPPTCRQPRRKCPGPRRRGRPSRTCQVTPFPTPTSAPHAQLIALLSVSQDHGFGTFLEGRSGATCCSVSPSSPHDAFSSRESHPAFSLSSSDADPTKHRDCHPAWLC